MAKNILHIIEPPLNLHDSHYFSFVDAICAAEDEIELHIWANNKFRYPLRNKNVHVHPYFNQRWRKFQFPILIRKLLAQEGKLLIPSAQTTYLLALYLFFRNQDILENKIYFFFHLVRMSKKKKGIFNRRKRKERFFRKVARKIQGINILAPTQITIEFFNECGFKNVKQVFYPINPKDYSTQALGEFDHLLFSGIPRIDKGVELIADLVEYYSKSNARVPIYVQITDDFSFYQDELKVQLNRILDANYSSLKILPHGLGYDEYRKLYKNAISLQLYDPEEFSDRASGVALDAMLNGTPVITRSGTWNARIVDRYNGGISLDKADLKNLLEAIDTVRASYKKFGENANKAGEEISKEHDASNLIGLIFRN